MYGPGLSEQWKPWPKAQPSCNIRGVRLEVDAGPKSRVGRKKFTKGELLLDHFLCLSQVCFEIVLSFE